MDSKTMAGLAVILTALLVVSATAGVYFYYEYNQAVQSRNTYVGELSAANSDYQRLASEYNASLSLYNVTLALLANAVGVLNTSLPAYQQASTELTHLWADYLALKPAPGSLYTADVLLDFGNGTLKWFNGTSVQPGWNAYTETVILTGGNMDATLYTGPGFGANGEHFVSAIDGVASTSSQYWFLWTYNKTASWQPSATGADLLPVYNGSVIAWTYCTASPSFAPECTP